MWMHWICISNYFRLSLQISIKSIWNCTYLKTLQKNFNRYRKETECRMWIGGQYWTRNKSHHFFYSIASMFNSPFLMPSILDGQDDISWSPLLLSQVYDHFWKEINCLWDLDTSMNIYPDRAFAALLHLKHQFILTLEYCVTCIMHERLENGNVACQLPAEKSKSLQPSYCQESCY